MNIKKIFHLDLLLLQQIAIIPLSLRKVLISVCGLHVDINHDSKNKLIITIMGDVSYEDILIASNILFPDLIELLDYSPICLKDALSNAIIHTITYI